MDDEKKEFDTSYSFFPHLIPPYSEVGTGRQGQRDGTFFHYCFV